MGTPQSRHTRELNGRVFEAGGAPPKTNNPAAVKNPKQTLNGLTLMASDTNTTSAVNINRPLSNYELANGTYNIRAKFYEAVGLLKIGTKNPRDIAYLQEVEKDLDESRSPFPHREKLYIMSSKLGYDVLAQSIMGI
jgi:hypothetical protein